MAVEIGALRALLSLDTAAFEKGAKRATASMNRVQANLAKMGKRFDQIGKDLTKKVSLPIVAAAGVAIKSSMSMIDSQAKLAQSLGTTTESMQVLGRAADLAGVSSGELEQVSIQLTKRLSQAAAGGGPAAEALDRLGLSAEALSAMPLDQRIATINEAIKDTVPAAEQAATAAQLFGDRAGLVASRLDSATIKTAADEIARFGVGVSDVDADKIEAANDAISSLGLVSRGLANQLTVALAPTLETIAKRVADVGAWFANLSPEAKKFAGIATAVAAAVGPAAIAIGMVATGLAAIASPIGIVIVGLAAAAGAAAYVAANWDALRERFPILDKAANFGSWIAEKWSTLPAIKWAALIPALSFAKFIPGLRWAAYIPSLTWSALIPVLKWSARFIPVIGWTSLVGGLAWNLLIKPLGWEKYLPKIEWDGWIPKVQWPDWIKSLSWRDFIPEIKWREWFDFEWAELVPDWDWSKIIPDFKSWFQFGGAIADAEAAGEDIGRGLVQGTSRSRRDARAAGADLADQARVGFEDAAGIQSPAREWIELAEYLIAGLVVGLDDKSQAAIDRATRLGKDIGEATKNAAEPIFRTIADGLAKGDLGSIGQGLKSQAQTAFSGKLQNVFAGKQTFGSIFTESFAGVKSAMSGTGTLLAKAGTALAAAMPVIGTALAVFEVGKAIVGTTTKLNNALEGTFTNAGLIRGTEYDIKQKDNLFGSKTEKNSEEIFGSWAGLIAKDLDASMQALAADISDGLGKIGLDVQDFAYNFDIKFDESLPHEQLMAQLQAEVAKAGDAMITASLAASGLTRSGETGAQTLAILNRALTVTNDYFDTLGWTLHEVSAIGAGAARQFSELFGGIDGMDRALSAYHEAVYTEGERMQTLGRQLGEMFADMGLAALPETREGIRSIVDGLMEAGSTDVAARIIQIAPALTQYIDHIQAQAAAAANAGIATSGMSAKLREVAIEIGTRFAAGMDFVVRNFYTTSQQLEFFGARASAAFEAAGLEMPKTAEAFRAAAQQAASDVQRILGMVAQGQASLADLERAKAEQLAIIELADEAKQVYDLQDQAAQERLAEAQRAAERAAARAAAIERQRQSAIDAASRTTSVSSLDQLTNRIGDAMRDIAKQSARAGDVSRDAAARIVALATTTGKAWESSFMPALDALKDIDASRFQTQVDFDRMRAETGNLLAQAQSSISSVREAPISAREQREYHNISVQQGEDIKDILDRLLSLERMQRPAT